jgi:hypothetical protein
VGCEVDDCSGDVIARGFCRPHYSRWWKYGTTDGPSRPSAVDRFHASYQKEPAPYGLATECWVWTRSLARRYPQFKAGGVQIKGHRFSYETFVGAVPEGHVIRHRCDRPACVNPDHLETGTHQENSWDRTDRGRTGYRKLTDAQVSEIRNRIAAGEPNIALAREFGVTPGMIGHIKAGRERTGPTRSRSLRE